MTERSETFREEDWERRRRSPVFAVSLTISILVHLLLIVLYPVWTQRRDLGDATPILDETIVIIQGTEIVTVVEIEDDPEAAPEEEEEEEAVEEPISVTTPDPDRATPVPVPTETDFPEGTPAERLRPNRENSRLWAPVDEELAELTDEERLQIEIEVQLQIWNDSVAAAAAAAAGATDWTHTDSEGNRWGISPGKLHLGKITLPLPIYFGPANGYERDRLAREAYELSDIERGAMTGAVRESMKERAKAIRLRKDAERAARMGEEPDTTRSN